RATATWRSCARLTCIRSNCCRRANPSHQPSHGRRCRIPATGNASYELLVLVRYLCRCPAVKAEPSTQEPSPASGIVSAKEESRRLADGKRTFALVGWRADPGDYSPVAVLRPLNDHILLRHKT